MAKKVKKEVVEPTIEDPTPEIESLAPIVTEAEMESFSDKLDEPIDSEIDEAMDLKAFNDFKKEQARALRKR